MKASDLLVKCLEEEGIEYIFGVPGEENADFMMSLEASGKIMDVVSMFRPVTKWATTILNPDTIPEIVRKAVRLARTEKPGAVHIELPEDIAAMDKMMVIKSESL